MEIQKFINKELIKINYEADKRESVLSYMANTLTELGYVKASFLEAILERENTYPSAIAFQQKAIAIPHTDAIHVNQSVLFFIRLAQPIEFRAMGSPDDMINVHFVSMFALKDKNEIGELLTALITAYQDVDLLEQLWIAKDEDEIYNLLLNKMSK